MVEFTDESVSVTFYRSKDVQFACIHALLLTSLFDVFFYCHAISFGTEVSSLNSQKPKKQQSQIQRWQLCQALRKRTASENACLINCLIIEFFNFAKYSVHEKEQIIKNYVETCVFACTLSPCLFGFFFIKPSPNKGDMSSTIRHRNLEHETKQNFISMH